MAQETSPGFVPFTTVPFKGVAENNGQVVNRSNAGYKTIGGQIDTADANNDDLIPYFGAVVSSDPTEALNEDGNFFTLGTPEGYLARGVIMFDASVAQNDPAKSSYILPGLPMAVVYEGTVRYQEWGATQAGAIDPILGALIIYNATDTTETDSYIGAVEFLPAGSAIPTDWAAFPGYIVQVDQSGVVIELDFANAGAVVQPGDPVLYVGTLTAAAAATPVVIVPDADVPTGKKFYPTNFYLKVNGATAWTDVTATVVIVEDTAGTDFFSVAKAQLTGNALLGPLSTGVTPAAAFYTGVGGGDGLGLQIKGDANFAAGSDIVFQVSGFIQ
jgi:hypothetical protein